MGKPGIKITGVNLGHRGIDVAGSTVAARLYTNSSGHYIQTANTVAYYRFEGNVIDTSGNGHNGIPTDVSYITGQVGYGAGFNGTTSKVLHDSLDLTTFTYSVWLQETDTSITRGFAGNISSGGTLCYLLFMTGAIYINLNYSSDIDYLFGYARSTNKVLITVTKSGTSLSVYKNADLINTLTCNSTETLRVTRFGTYRDSFFYGMEDQLIIENVAWDDAKISAYYDETK